MVIDCIVLPVGWWIIAIPEGVTGDMNSQYSLFSSSGITGDAED